MTWLLCKYAVTNASRLWEDSRLVAENCVGCPESLAVIRPPAAAAAAATTAAAAAATAAAATWDTCFVVVMCLANNVTPSMTNAKKCRCFFPKHLNN